MKKQLLVLFSIILLFCQCQEKSILAVKETNTQSAIIDSLNQLVQLKTNQVQEYNTVAQLHVALAYAYYKNYQFQLSIDNYKKSNDIWQQADAKRFNANINENYLNIASVYDDLGDYSLASNYYQQALNNFIAEKNTALIIDTYLCMGVAALHAKDSFKIILLEKGLAFINSQKKPDLYLKAALSQCLGKAEMDYRHNYSKSFFLFNSALIYYQSIADTANIAETAIEIANNYLHQADYSAATMYANQSLILRKLLKSGKSVESYQVLGQIAKAQQNPDSALYFYQKALQTIDPTFKENNVLINPKINPKTFNRKIELIYLLERKADPLSIVYQKKKDSRYLQAALATYQLADKSVQVLRREMQDDQSKYFWNETALPIYKKGIDVAYQLFELEQNPQAKLEYKLNVLQFSGRTKAPVLREGIADNQAKSFAGVPAEERQRERELRATIAILEKQTTVDAKITEQLTKTRTQLYAFQDSLKAKYPTYNRYLAATIEDTPLSINDLKRVQNQLSDTTLLIEYAFGSHDLYQISVSNTDFQIFKTPLTPDFYTQIARFNYAVNNYDAIKKDFNATGQAYAATSFDLYQRLLEQPLTRTGHSSKVVRDSSKPSVFKCVSLILDNDLHLFPFKALTDSPVKGWVGDFPEHYLVKRYAFSSLFSIQSLLKNTLPKNNWDRQSVSSTDTANLKLACFGLDFKKDTLWRPQTPKTTNKSKKNSPLNGAEAEIDNIRTKFNGKRYFNGTATKDSFLNNAAKYDFLHITTHGYPEGLVFQKSNAQDTLNEVTIGDIYGLPLHTRFTFLSACETGKGKLTEAEGVMSLGRAFTFSGSESVIMSLWSIPDGATSKIAQSFYTYYHQGVPKDVALQRAEMDFLSIAPDAQTLPNHWAALTIIGDMSPLEQPQITTNWWVWGLLAGIGLFGFLFAARSVKGLKNYFHFIS
jgi:CHAT domain-containing protein